MPKPRARDLGLDMPGETGPWNAITDVPGVRVGMTTLIDPDRGIRTGVTAILPRGAAPMVPARAGHAVLNGNGEMTGVHWIDDAGWLRGPVLITNTHSVGIAHHAAVRWMIANGAAAFRERHLWAMPVVAETYDGVLNDINGQHVTEADALAALDGAAEGPVAEGGVGGGAGMIAYEFKGGTGTASRRVRGPGGATWTVGALVQANHGIRPWLTVLGVPVGREMTGDRLPERETGSIIVVLATDAPLSALSLRHLARRAGLGVGRGGSPGGDSSGDIFLAVSVADWVEPDPATLVRHAPELDHTALDPFYLAAVEAVEEAVLNAMLAGEDAPTVKPKGGVCRAIDAERLRAILRRAGRTR